MAKVALLLAHGTHLFITRRPPTQQVDALDQPPDAVVIMLTHDFTTSIQAFSWIVSPKIRRIIKFTVPINEP
ncbi:MAG: hypothetical protein LUQ26_14150 [Methylococcaceae bacterium]|nr:hypothetical protein [Methylococcaceae bacterium]